MPVQGAARGRHIRSRLERLNSRIKLLHAYIEVGHQLSAARERAKAGDTALLPLNFPFPTFRAARAEIKRIPRKAREQYEADLRFERSEQAAEKQRKEKARLQSDVPAQQHKASVARREERKPERKSRHHHTKHVRTPMQLHPEEKP